MASDVLWRQRVGSMGLYLRREVWARDTYLKMIIIMGVITLRTFKW